MQNAHRPVLSYESPAVQEVIALLPAMRAWRRLAGWGFWLSIIAGFIHPFLFYAAFTLLIVSTAGALVLMTRAAAREAGAGYAARQLALALILLPCLFCGVFLVTRLVEADLINWRLSERPPVEK